MQIDIQGLIDIVCQIISTFDGFLLDMTYIPDAKTEEVRSLKLHIAFLDAMMPVAMFAGIAFGVAGSYVVPKLFHDVGRGQVGGECVQPLSPPSPR